ncbi:MAG: class I SAM-dependent methyltransferase [Candidatus Omnitrophica bacterium]|nr:class I SAM-dependent methyltransferase [Candidatus Omnitrophota bacterium]
MSGERPRDIIRHFYDNFGWKKDARSGRSLGELAHEDLDPRTQAYMDANEERYCSLFQQPGRYFLDAASGGEPRTRFSGSFQYHVCADISILGLSEAREVLGERGLYVIADLAALPFREGVFDGAIASHCLYHVDKAQQPAVVKEMARVTRSGKNILIFTRTNAI